MVGKYTGLSDSYLSVIKVQSSVIVPCFQLLLEGSFMFPYIGVFFDNLCFLSLYIVAATSMSLQVFLNNLLSIFLVSILIICGNIFTIRLFCMHLLLAVRNL